MKIKTTIICGLALAGLGFLTSCTYETREPATHTSTTTTEQTTVRQPRSNTVETTTYRTNQ